VGGPYFFPLVTFDINWFKMLLVLGSDLIGVILFFLFFYVYTQCVLLLVFLVDLLRCFFLAKLACACLSNEVPCVLYFFYDYPVWCRLTIGSCPLFPRLWCLSSVEFCGYFIVELLIGFRYGLQ